MWKPQPNWPFANWLRLMELLRGESCPSGERRGPTATEEDKFPCPGQKPLLISSTPTTRGRKRTATGCLPPHRLCNPQPNLLVADWLRLKQPARGDSCLSGQRRGPATPGEDRVSSPEQKFFHTSTNPTTGGHKRRSPASIPPHRVWKPQPH